MKTSRNSEVSTIPNNSAGPLRAAPARPALTARAVSAARQIVRSLASLRRSGGAITGDTLCDPRPPGLGEGLRNGEEQFRHVVEALPNSVVVVGPDGRIKTLNALAERAFGYSRAELLGQPVETLLPKRYRGHHPSLRMTFLADPRPRAMGAKRDLYAVRKDGSEFPVEIGLGPMETAAGTIVLISIIDITERRETETRLWDAKRRSTETLAALSESEEQLKRTQRLARIGSDVRDLRTDEAVWSEETYRIFGVSRETYIPSTENFLRMLHPDDRQTALATRTQIVQGDMPGTFRVSDYSARRPLADYLS